MFVCEPADEPISDTLPEPVPDRESGVVARAEPHPYQVSDRVVVLYEGREVGAEVTFRAHTFASMMLRLDDRVGPYADRMPVLFDPVTGNYVDILDEKPVRITTEKVDRK